MDILFQINELEKQDKYTKFEISPLAAGYGHTLATALRRVMLTSLEGSAITGVKINGVRHQFSTLKGMKEDVLDFLLNLKKVRFSSTGGDRVKITLSATGPGEVKAGDIKVPSSVTIANPELVLANLSKGGKLSADMVVEAGTGYVTAEEREAEEVGYMPLDAIFTPVERVNYKVEDTRVGRVTNYDKIIFEVWTDGTVDPKIALTQSAKILTSYLAQIVDPQEVKSAVPVEDESGLGMVGKLSVEEIGLPTRVANALAKSGFDTVEKLVNAKREDLMKVRNLGEKSISVINDALKEKGAELKYA
ncbi:DNA-directed RNA polymerase subunit alpha [Candidatus Woesebacteria bacterium RIFCSPHIGHO2_01_FULL_41_10]|uniref:DNA-directed RNA polymerase subunit alpha n=1 Tax=Candidatus Woesebacteria bacterium RIFCSPHIGHO2_01_FULL_41_10 TaxID=1802500 RepID=A0A1F7YSR7_9BACT|nr:MAG: DNA-directed RNA polymerase subunit alpha [Candidatus Woesebacteria bacterium RIFCSPHIGHO2_01_FULL_41_10]